MTEKVEEPTLDDLPIHTNGRHSKNGVELPPKLNKEEVLEKEEN